MIVAGAPQEALVRFGVETWNRLKQERLYREETWYECLMAYNSRFGKSWGEINQYRSNRYFPISWSAVENVTAKSVQSTMPNPKWFNVEGTTPDDTDKARAMKALMRWQHQKSNFRQKWAAINKSLCIFGNVPWCQTWASQVVPIPDHAANDQLHQLDDQSEGAGLDVTRNLSHTKDTVLYDGPILHLGNIFDYVEDRWANDRSYATRISRFFKDKSFMLGMAQLNADGYAVFENIESVPNDFPRSERSDALRRTVDMKSGFVDIPPDMIELLQVEGDMIMMGDAGPQLYRNHVLVIANRTTVVRFEPNPFDHGMPTWNLATINPEPNNSPYGRGILEPNLDFQDTLNVRWNQILDSNSLTVNPLMGYVRDGVFDPDAFMSAPGQLIEMAAKGNVWPIVVPNEYALGMQDIGFLMAQFNQATGAMESFTTENYQKSATEVQANVQMASARAMEQARHLETILRDMLNMQMKLNQQLMYRSVWIRLLENEQTQQIVDPETGMPMNPMQIGLQVSPADIQGSFDIRCTGAENLANAQQRMQQKIQIAQQVLQFAPEVIKKNELARSLFQDAGIQDASTFIKTDQEIQQEMMNAQLQQAQQSQANPNGALPPHPGGPRGPHLPGPGPAPGGVASMAGVPAHRPPIPGGPRPEQFQGRRPQ